MQAQRHVKAGVNYANLIHAQISRDFQQSCGKVASIVTRASSSEGLHKKSSASLRRGTSASNGATTLKTRVGPCAAAGRKGRVSQASGTAARSATGTLRAKENDGGKAGIAQKQKSGHANNRYLAYQRS